jgi:hypothetical protein
MSEREPVRLLEADSEASPELRELLGAASLDEPSAAQLGALAGKLGPLLGPGGGAPPAGSTPGAGPAASAPGGLASTVASGLKLKVLAGVAGAALLGGSFQAGRVFEREHPASSPVERGVSAPRQPAPEPASMTAPVATHTPAPAVTPVPEPEVTPVAPSPRTSAVPAPRVPRPRASETPAPAAAAEGASVDEELTLLESAYQALRRGDAAGALAEAERHAARFPAGALAQEREVLAIDALVRMGRRAEAERRAEAFRARYPTSTHGVRIQNLLSGAKP